MNLQITGKPAFSQARIKLLQKLQKGININKNARRILSHKKKSSYESYSDSQSISLPSSPSEQDVEEENEEDREDEEDEEGESPPKKQELKKKRKTIRKAWKNKCCKCRRNGRMKCSCSGSKNSTGTLNLNLKVESSKPATFSVEPEGDVVGCDLPETFTSTDFISGLTEKNFHPEMSIAKSPSQQMLLTNTNVSLTKTTLTLETTTLPKSHGPLRSNPVKVRKLKRHFVPDSASRRKSALNTFINQLSLRPIVRKIGLEHSEFGPS